VAILARITGVSGSWSSCGDIIDAGLTDFNLRAVGKSMVLLRPGNDRVSSNTPWRNPPQFPARHLVFGKTRGGIARMWYSPSSLRAFLAGKLTPERKAWFSKTRHGEQTWQRSIRRRVSPPLGSSAAISTYDAREEQTQSLAQVRSVLGDAGIEFAELPRLSHYSPTLVVDNENTEAVL